MRLVDPDGNQLGIKTLPEALSIARELELDLVEVAPLAEPPVCRILNYGKWKYEAAQRMAQLGRFDEAIPMFQQARNDPKLRNPATLQLGTTFLAAGFHDEAVDTIKELMESYQAISTGDDLAKEIYYWHGRALEAKADVPSALRSYSQVVKWDFNYKDVQGRIKKLRAAAAQPQA